jgi:hypothetical protein
MLKKEVSLGRERVGVYAPTHPGANNRGYVPRSRHRLALYLGRDLSPHEVVHHKNGDSTDDRLYNLTIVSRADHCRMHAEGRRKLNYGRIRKLLRSGLSYKEIAIETGYKADSIYRACCRQGLQ